MHNRYRNMRGTVAYVINSCRKRSTARSGYHRHQSPQMTKTDTAKLQNSQQNTGIRCPRDFSYKTEEQILP